jgi:hypothetical protein
VRDRYAFAYAGGGDFLALHYLAYVAFRVAFQFAGGRQELHEFPYGFFFFAGFKFQLDARGVHDLGYVFRPPSAEAPYGIHNVGYFCHLPPPPIAYRIYKIIPARLAELLYFYKIP